MLRVCSLFAGIGGIDLAFSQAGFDIIWANEYAREMTHLDYLEPVEKMLIDGDQMDLVVMEDKLTVACLFEFLICFFLKDLFHEHKKSFP